MLQLQLQTGYFCKTMTGSRILKWLPQSVPWNYTVIRLGHITRARILQMWLRLHNFFAFKVMQKITLGGIWLNKVESKRLKTSLGQWYFSAGLEVQETNLPITWKSWWADSSYWVPQMTGQPGWHLDCISVRTQLNCIWTPDSKLRLCMYVLSH